MRILGVDIPREPLEEGGGVEYTLVLLDAAGRMAQWQQLPSLLAVAGAVTQLSAGEPFLLGVDVPVVVPAKPTRARPIENLIRRRIGVRLPAGGRAALAAEPRGIAGEALIAALAAAGAPCLPYPDRNGRRPCLAETWPALILKTLLWESSTLSGAHGGREETLRAYPTPVYRGGQLRTRGTWAQQAGALDLAQSALGDLPGYDLAPAREALAGADSLKSVERAGALFDALLIAGTARRYLESPESCAFAGDQEGGYLILPADGFVRRLALGATRETGPRLFPQTSLRERLGQHARLRSGELLAMPGRPQRTEAEFSDPPRYEFDNLDEMLWWKHCRHLAGPILPTEGLRELTVTLDAESAATPLKLQRSRHRTLSFRFEPPGLWRGQVPTRDGRTYPFRVLRATYETLPTQD